MDLVQSLQDNASRLIEEASAAVARSHLRHYDAAGFSATRARIAALHARLMECLSHRQLRPLVDHAQLIAAKRFASGYDLFEVQVAFNALEEAIWRHVFETFPPGEVAQALGLATTALSAGKDALARAYVALASGTHAPPVDVRSLFSGAGA